MSRPTPKKSLAVQRDLIDQKTHEFLRNGGKIKREEIGVTRTVDLTFRHYSVAAMNDQEGASDEEE